MTHDELLRKSIDAAFTGSFTHAFTQRDDTALLAAIDTACEFLEDRMDVLDSEDGPRPDAFMSLFQHLDEVRAIARGERWPR